MEEDMGWRTNQGQQCITGNRLSKVRDPHARAEFVVEVLTLQMVFERSRHIRNEKHGQRPQRTAWGVASHNSRGQTTGKYETAHAADSDISLWIFILLLNN
jgi:hypothetical protein